MTESPSEKLVRLKAKNKNYCIGDEQGRAVNEEDVDWLIEQAERAEKYNKALWGINTALRWSNDPLQDIKEELRKVGWN